MIVVTKVKHTIDMYNNDSYIANETARSQLEDTQHKTKFRHLWTHTMRQGKTSAMLREKPTDNLASTILVTQNNADTKQHYNYVLQI